MPIVVGYTNSLASFPTTAPLHQSTNGGGFDAFVTKYNPAGTGLLYSTYLGSGSTDEGFAVAVDGSGDAFVTGETNSLTFPTTTNAYGTGVPDTWDAAFVSELSPTGSSLIYSTDLSTGPSSQNDLAGHAGNGIAVDSSGDHI